MMEQIQAAAHGAIIRNEYFVAIRTDYDGCTCCDTTPLARTPLQIVPVPNPACWFSPPPGFAPQVQPVVMMPVPIMVGYPVFIPPPMPAMVPMGPPMHPGMAPVPMHPGMAPEPMHPGMAPVPMHPGMAPHMEIGAPGMAPPMQAGPT